MPWSVVLGRRLYQVRGHLRCVKTYRQQYPSGRRAQLVEMLVSLICLLPRLGKKIETSLAIAEFCFLRVFFLWGAVSIFGMGCVSSVEIPAKNPSKNRMLVRTTAYTHTEPGGSSSAVGTRLRFGSDVCSAASDWSWMPVGTRFTVLSTRRVYVIEDYGSALVGKKTIDLYMPTDGMMRNWGVRWEEIEIQEWGSIPISRMLLEKRRDNRTVRAMLASMPSEKITTRSD
jgi:3D (Asp-Asp-Asp) domain-containing protein